jgi:hypothetical protein
MSCLSACLFVGSSCFCCGSFLLGSSDFCSCLLGSSSFVSSHHCYFSMTTDMTRITNGSYFHAMRRVKTTCLLYMDLVREAKTRALVIIDGSGQLKFEEISGVWRSCILINEIKYVLNTFETLGSYVSYKPLYA